MDIFGLLLFPVIVFACVVLGLAFIVFMVKTFGVVQTGQGGYSCLPALLTPAERSFYGVLVRAVGSDGAICPKVRIADVIQVNPQPANSSEGQTAFNRIAMKHFDFVVCDTEDFSVRYAVELDDSSHLNLKQVERDKFVDGVCRSAGIPLVRIKAQSGYSIAAIAGTIKAELDSQKEEFDF